MLVGIDYDNTVTLDSHLWHVIIFHIINRGHECVIVSCRTDNDKNRKEISNWLDNIKIPIILTSHLPKRDYALSLGYNIHVWIDDTPETISKGEMYRLNHYDVFDKINALKNIGQRIVFTNGCFDLLHVGHLKTLEFAKKHGDVLVVGINSDNSVKRLKGDNRPIINEADRASLLNALSCVDYVITFDSDTCSDLINKIQPNVFVKGGTSLFVEQEVEECKKNNCLMFKMEYEKSIIGMSTTEIEKRIRQ